MKKSKFIWLKTARVTSHKSDGTAVILRNTVKLEDGDNFKKFLKYINTMGLLNSEPPKIVNVLVNGESVDEIEKYQKLVELAINPAVEESVDYKKENSNLKAKLDSQQSQIDELKALIEGKTDKPEDGHKGIQGVRKSDSRLTLENHANKLDIKFRSDISDDKLILKIKEAEGVSK